MRRKDREITNIEDIITIIKKCDVCRLAFFDKEYPYIIPLNFGMSYEKEILFLYFHGANVGKKLDLIKSNNKVAFEMDCSHKLIKGNEACNYTMEYESVCGTGIIEFLPLEEKIKGLTFLMKQYTDMDNFYFKEKVVEVTEVYRLRVTNISGKKLVKE